MVLVVFGGANYLHAQYWQPDPTFTPPGLEVSPRHDVYIPTQLLHDGSVIVFPGSRYINGKYIIGCVKLDPSGAIDPSYKGPEALPDVYPLFAYPDSRVLFTTLSADGKNSVLFRLSASGEVDPSFKPDFGTDTVSISNAALQADGKILLAGAFTPFAGPQGRGLLRLNADGSPDPSFAANVGQWTSASWVSIQNDGKILVVGITSNPGSMPHVARLNSDGTPDNTFTDTFTVGSTFPHWVVQLTDGHLLASLPTNFSDFLVETDSAGTVDHDFSPTTPGYYSVPPPPAANGKIYFSWNDPYHGNHVRRLNADGTLDVSFDVIGESNVAPLGIPQISDSGLLYFNSPVTNARKSSSFFLSQTDTFGVLNTNYAPRLGELAYGVSIAQQADGKYLALSDAAVVANHTLTTLGLSRLNHDGSFDAFISTFQLGLYDATSVKPLPSGKIAGRVNNGFFSVSPDGSVTMNFLAPNIIHGLQSRPDTFSDFASDGSFYQRRLDDSTRTYSVCHYSIDCTLDNAFQFSSPEELRVYPAPNGMVYVDQEISGLVRLKRDGEIDPTFKTVPASAGRYVWVFPDSTVFLTEPQNSDFVSGATDDFTSAGARETHYDLEGNAQFTFDGLLDVATVAGTVYDRLKTTTSHGNIQSYITTGTELIVSATGETTVLTYPPSESHPLISRLVRTSATQSYNPAPIAARVVSPFPSAAIGSSTTLTAKGGGLYPLQYQWYLNNKKIPGATNRSFNIASAVTGDSGNYTVTISNRYGQATSPSISLLVAAAPQVVLQPVGASAEIGGTASFSVVGSPGTTYEWQYETPGQGWYSIGTYPAYQGAGTNQLKVVHITADLYGTMYRCVVTDPSTGISTTSSPALLNVLGINPSMATARFANISTRAYVGVGASIEIGGFIISGSQPKQVLIRGLGPALTPYGVSGALPDPELKIFSGQSQIASNDDWSSDSANSTSVTTATTQLQITPFPDGSKDAALVVTLAPGGYTAQLTGKNSATGIGLIEVYETDSNSVDTRLINISTRSETRSGAGIQIAGFIINGTQPKPVLIRALGPALQNAHVNGFLVDPVLTLFSGQDKLFQNDDWSSTDYNAAEIESATTAANAVQLPRGSSDSAIYAILAPGAYTAQVSGKNGHTGVSLIEVYEVP